MKLCPFFHRNPKKPMDLVLLRLERILIDLDNMKYKLRVIERKIEQLGETQMATADDIITKVTEQTTIIDSVRTLVEQLQAAADDPAKLQEIVNALDTNNAALAVLANTPVPA